MESYASQHSYLINKLLMVTRWVAISGLFLLIVSCSSSSDGDNGNSSPVNNVPTGSVIIDNMTPTQGDTLTASNTLADIDGLGPITYQWQHDRVDIAGATGTTYTTTQDDVGKAIRVVASYTDGGGTNESVSSAETSNVTSILNLLVDAGADQTIVLSGSANLTAVVTENGQPPAGTITYSWSQLPGPGTGSASFTSPDSAQTSVSFSAIGSYKLQVQAVSDTDTAVDTIDIAVNTLAAGGSGLTIRPSNPDCVAPASPPTASSIKLDPAFPNLPALTYPLAMYMAPGDTSNWYVVQQGGQVIKFANNPGVNSVTQFIDISDRIFAGGEAGLLGMAFHPDFANNHYVYLSYTTELTADESRISRFTLNTTTQTLDPGSEVIILRVPQPEWNHNGGQIMFGPDGYLYIGFGDGGGAGDTYLNGQNTDTLLGAILRIDVGDGSSGTYTIPPGNPFAGSGGSPKEEIFAYGLRNPWRWSFDSATGELWAGDVGQGAYEEIDKITNGANYGWNIMEGLHCYNAASCDQTGLTLPVTEYDHYAGKSVTGGYVYHGSAIPFLQGHYIYADFITGTIWGLEQTGPNQYTSTELLNSNQSIASFAEDENGELYIVNLVTGIISKIAPDTSSQPGGVIPAQLSGWVGCFDANDTSTFSSSVIPYNINALLWSDFASKERFFAIPNGTTINIDSEGRFDLPVGSVVGKNFRLGGQLIETRLLLHHQPPDGWKGYSYEWNGTDATLLTNYLDKDINGQTWHYPSQAECESCHTTVAGFTLGPEIGQLNRTLLYPGPDSTNFQANQLITLEDIGVLPLLTNEQKSTSFYAIDNTVYSSERRARSYLHSNCANCHQPGGPGGGNMDLRFSTPLANMNICYQPPLGDTLGLTNPRIINPGNPDLSILVLRMEDTGQNRMPPLATAEVDTYAMSVIRDWITNLSSCN